MFDYNWYIIWNFLGYCMVFCSDKDQQFPSAEFPNFLRNDLVGQVLTASYPARQARWL